MSTREIQVIFLDRDGVINKQALPHEYITRWEDFIILPGVYEALRIFNDIGAKVFIISNQRGIATGKITLEQVNELHKKMLENFLNHNCHIDGIYICPHDYSDNCICRKPKTGLFIQAEKDLLDSGFTINKNISWMIGDFDSDEEAGINFGVNTILISDSEHKNIQADGKKHLNAKNLLDSAIMIQRGEI